MASFGLSSFATLVEDKLDPIVRYGLYHRLTGEAVGVSQALADVLRTAQGRLIQFSSTPENDYAISSVIYHLRSAGLLVSDPADELQELRGAKLVRPAQRSSIAVNAGPAPTLFRVDESQRVFGAAPGTGERVYQEAMPLDAWRLFALSDGTYGLADAEIAVGGASRLRTAIDWLTDPQRQAIKLMVRDDDRIDAPHNRVVASLCTPHSLVRGPWSQHASTAGPAQRRFDSIEPTIAHAFRRPSPALGGTNYGTRILTRIRDRIPRIGARILEVGGGTGDLAVGFVTAYGPTVDYTLIDIAPSLAAAQKKALVDCNVNAKIFVGDCEAGLPGGPYDLIIANEVVADLTVSQDTGDLHPIGIIRLLRHISQALTPRGLAIITEYTSRAGSSQPVRHLDHQEYAVNFNSLIPEIVSLGFEPDLTSLAEFLGADLDARVADGEQGRIEAVSKALKACGAPGLEMAVYGEAEYEERTAVLRDRGVVGLECSALRRGAHFGPAFQTFMALLLTRKGIS
jgi:SAM-dependent methyltransferase